MKRILLSFLCSMVVVSAFSWGATGHRATGQIAEQYLSSKAKARLSALLGQETLAMASTWMDDIRSDSTYAYADDWHWVTLPPGVSYEQSTKNPKGDLIMTIQRLIRELKAHNLNKAQEIEHVKMLIHLIGDIHQPLHVGISETDEGGNKVKVKWFRNDSNLHRVWDSDMINDSRLSYTELAASLIRPDKTVLRNWQNTGVLEWAKESADLSPAVYKIGDGNLGYKYNYVNMPIVRERILQAGIRIAAVLNAIYA